MCVYVCVCASISHAATSYGHLALIELLIHGTYTKLNDPFFPPPQYTMMSAASVLLCFLNSSLSNISLDLSVCLSISAAGADLNARDLDGDTPLHICESPQVAEYLLANGADEQAVNTEGKSVYEQALELENQEMVIFWAARLGLTVTYSEQEGGQSNVPAATMEAVQEGEGQEEAAGEDSPPTAGGGI
jgi:ankyrin repeat protein